MTRLPRIWSPAIPSATTRSATIASLLALALALTGCANDADPAGAPTTAVDSATSPVGAPGTPTETIEPPPPTNGDDADQGELAGIPVYYVGEAPSGPRLFREFRSVPDLGDPVTSAVTAMTSLAPRDPDYFTPWVAVDEVSVQRDGDVLVVDLPAQAFTGNLGGALSIMALHQLVYTATAADSLDGDGASQVLVLIDGEPGDAWGHVVVGDEPVTRAPQTEVLNWSWILSPSEGEVLEAGEVTLTGYGASFEANFVVTVIGKDGDGNDVQIHEPTTSTNGTGFGAWELKVELEPGDYTVVAVNSSGVEDFEPDTDSKSFAVR